MTVLDKFPRFTTSSARSMCVLMVATCIALSACAQQPQAWVERIEQLRTQIKSGEEQHAGAAQMGRLWLQLANRYQYQVEFPQAEDAFARALRLLKGTDAQAEIADAVDGMGSLYLATGRFSEAEEFTRRALKMYDTLGQRFLMAKMHDEIALELLAQNRYREAAGESAEGLMELHALAAPDAGELIAAYLTHSTALCDLRRCSEAVGDATHAMEIAQDKFPVGSLERVVAYMSWGCVKWKSGAPEQGEQAMREAVEAADALKNLPQPVLVSARLQAMRQYQTFLQGTHRKPEAKQLEAEIGRLSAGQPPSCAGCTVSVAALAPGLLLP